jgi:hypothetical protein
MDVFFNPQQDCSIKLLTRSGTPFQIVSDLPQVGRLHPDFFTQKREILLRWLNRPCSGGSRSRWKADRIVIRSTTLDHCHQDQQQGQRRTG